MLRTLAGLPPVVFYLVVGLGAAIENVVPPIPADTVVLLGAFLAAEGRANIWVIFLITWLANVSTAFGVYALSLRYGTRIAGAPFARWVLQPHQIEQVSRFYDRFGVPALAISRFLPAFRAVVPIFAGVSRMPWQRVLPPIAAASALWYGILVSIGTVAGKNWELVVAAFGKLSRILLLIAVPILILLIFWWWWTRQRHD